MTKCVRDAVYNATVIMAESENCETNSIYTVINSVSLTLPVWHRHPMLRIHEQKAIITWKARTKEKETLFSQLVPYGFSMLIAIARRGETSTIVFLLLYRLWLRRVGLTVIHVFFC